MTKPRNFRFVAALAIGAILAAGPALASSISGTVTFQGDVFSASPIPGIAYSDLVVSSGPGIASSGGGEHCTIDTNGSAPVDALGAYPASGTLAVGLTIDRGGPQPPDGFCLVQLRAVGNDGGAVSAYGTVTVEVGVADISGNALLTVANDILVRQSKTHAGVSKDCLKYTKKQSKALAKCNRSLWIFGGAEGSLKCKDAGLEPVDCDPANYAEAAVALAFGGMDQRVDPPSALAIDLAANGDQAKCQTYLGKAATGFLAKRNQLVQKNCVAALADSDSCRAQAVNDSKSKLSLIDNCVTAQVTDAGSGLLLAQAGEPCESQCVTIGVIDRKCLKDCFELELSTLSDSLIGDVPECGNGILQGGEVCDDGNLTNGDCCTSTCTVEPAGSQSCGVGQCQVTVAQCSLGAPVTCTPGAPGVEAGNCADGVDNDCDGLVDLADSDCP